MNGQTASSATLWRDFLNDVRGIGADYLRFKLLDVERDTDERNIPDRADLAERPGGTLGQPAAQVPLWVWLAAAAALVIGVALVARVK